MSFLFQVLRGVVTNLPKTLISICGPLNAHAMHEVKVRLTSIIVINPLPTSDNFCHPLLIFASSYV